MPGHQLNECKYPRGCHNCGGRHHQSICFRSRAPIQNEATNEEPSGLGAQLLSWTLQLRIMSRPREAFCFRLQPQSLQTKIGRNQSQWEFVGQWQSAIIRNWQSQIEAGIKVNVNQDPLLKHVWRNRVPKPKMSSHNLAPTNQQQCVRVDFSRSY